MENKIEYKVEVGDKYKWPSYPHDIATITKIEGDTIYFECDSDNYKGDTTYEELVRDWKDGKIEEPKDLVVNPPHYTTTKISVLEVVNDWGLDFYLGNALKYMKRYELKGNPIQDLEKAVQYLNLKIQLLKDGNTE